MKPTDISSADDISALFRELDLRLQKGEFRPDMSIVDCHIHTYFSDAINYSLEKFIHDLDTRNVLVFSLTEHDNFNSTPLIKELLSGRDCTYITGIELSTRYTPDHNMHIKGFFPEMPRISSKIMQYCIDTCEKRVERMKKVIEIVNSRMRNVTLLDAPYVARIRFSIDSILEMAGKPPLIEGIAMPPFLNTYMLSSEMSNILSGNKNVIEAIYWSLHFGIQNSICQDAKRRKDHMSETEIIGFLAKYGVRIEEFGVKFDKDIDWNSMIEHVLLLPDSRGYKPLFYVDKPNALSPEDAIALIKDSGGVAELAHPFETYRNNTGLLMSDLQRLNFDGIEVHSPKNPRDYVKIYSDIASGLGKYTGFGSDTHGPITSGKRDLGVLTAKD